MPIPPQKLLLRQLQKLIEAQGLKYEPRLINNYELKQPLALYDQLNQKMNVFKRVTVVDPKKRAYMEIITETDTVIITSSTAKHYKILPYTKATKVLYGINEHAAR